MRQTIGKKIDTYYNIRYNMQNCNTCSSNPKNKIYNYHTFDSTHNTKQQDDMIIEGLSTNTAKVKSVSSNLQTFNGLYADYLKCSAPNNIACAKLQTEYDAQTTKVNNLENDYNNQQKIHTDCSNLKTRCEIFNDNINETQEVIDGINKKGRAQHNLLKSFQNTSTIESGRDFLNKNNIDMCDKNIDYSNKIDNLIDLKKTYNTNKENTQKEVTFKEKEIFNNSNAISDSTKDIVAYTADKDTYNRNSTSNYDEANKTRQNCHRSCRWTGPWYWRRHRCSTSCNTVPKHNAHWKNHYNSEGNRWKEKAKQEQTEINKENKNKKKLENNGKKYNNEKIQLETNIKTINTDIETNKTNMTNLKNDCSREQMNALRNLRGELEANLRSKRDTEVEYKDICNSKQKNCDNEYAVFQPIEESYNNEKLAKTDLKNRHEICVDPYRNDCKDLYNNYRNAQSNTKISASIVEKLQNYSDLDDAPATHTKIKANYTTVQGDFNKLKTKEQEMNVKLNKNNSLYESPIDKHDKVLYTNLLLTAFATSLLYVVFVEM
jgi:hypothetical protein